MTETIMDLVRTYRMYQKMLRHPHLMDEMRSIFVSALTAKGVADQETLQQEAKARLEEGNLDEKTLEEVTHALTDLYFANAFSDTEIENHINLARKQERFQNLSKVVNMEGATPRTIRQALKEFCSIPQGDLHISPTEAEGVRVALIDHFISSQLPFIRIAKHHITIRDIDEMLDHAVWSTRRPGKIGGKAAGMLLAHKIILPRLSKRDSELEDSVAIPDSYYFDSGILSDFIDYNGLHHFHSLKYKSLEAIEQEYGSIIGLFVKASFPPDIVNQFRGFLEHIGEHPLILRSSSLLEDNFGFAFSGKYESVFVANQGSLEKRLQDFIGGLKRVHMSTLAPTPILYRRDHNLLDFDEKMSVLVQRVVGRRFGDFFFPFVGGVAFSHNVYHWTPRIRKEDGLVRLVLGLGTRAVERLGLDYPRLIPLSHPSLRPEMTAEQIMKYSQKLVDVLNLRTGNVETLSCMDLLETTRHPDGYFAVSVNREGHLAAPLFKTSEIDLTQSVVTFENLIGKTPFAKLMKKVLQKLEQAYGHPIDMEFAWDADRLYILQCRFLPLREELHDVSVPRNITPERLLFRNDQGISSSIVKDIEYLVYVDPRGYGRLTTYEERIAIGRVVGRLNRILEAKRYGLFGPGRWGSNDINAGVKVGYGDINRTLILGEIAFEEEGSAGTLSYGTHFFNDLVEARIVPVAIYPDQAGTRFNEDFFLQSPNLLGSLAPDLQGYASIVHVIHVPSSSNGLLLQVYQDSRKQEGVGFLGTSG
jgi:hypothetical protein